MPYHQPNKLEPIKGNRFHVRRILHFWPLLVWVAVLFTGIWAYQQGVVFRRMNGAVDVYQENVSPTEDGTFQGLADGVERGRRVVKDQPIAFMSTVAIDAEIRAVKTEIEIERQDRLREFDQELRKMEAELRKIDADYQGALAEAKSYKEAADAILSRQKAAFEAMKKQLPNLGGDMPPDETAAKYLAEISKLNAQAGVWKEQMAKAQKEYDLLSGERLALEKLSIEKDEDLLKIAGHSQAVDYQDLQAKRQRMVLKATTSGIVDRILKEPGEYVKTGEGILKIVADPTQIIGFLPEDQLSQIHPGKTVWITPSHNRTTSYESKILFLAPRMNSLPDSTSPLPNKMLHGRDIICEYPKSAIVANGPDGQTQYSLLSGQTVIIHIERPGNVPLINQIFRNDDAE